MVSRPTSRRPATAQTRPGTARPQTSASTRHEASYVVALLEGRGVGREVGLAALDRDTGRVVLVQLSDCQTYVKTLHQMHLHNPCLILVPDTFLSSADASIASRRGSASHATRSLLVDFIREEFPDVPIESVPRKYWNATNGLEFIQQLCVEDEERAGTILAVSNKYYVLSSASALFKHVELRLNTRFASATLRIRCLPVDGTMMIDPESARNLELVGNLSYKKSTHSIFGILNHTYTAMAARLLRVNILSPITGGSARLVYELDIYCDLQHNHLWMHDSTSLKVRTAFAPVCRPTSSFEQEFIKDEDLFDETRKALKALNKMDFDKLIAMLVSSESKPTNTAQGAAARVSQMLNLRNVVHNLPLLRNALEGTRSQLLQIVHNMLSDERLERIDNLIRMSLNEDTSPTKNGIAAVNARVYAVKANYNRLLDVARETYKENVGDIYSLNNMLTEAHDLPLNLVYLDTGFVFSLKKSDLEDQQLPKGFINATLKKGKWQFSSLELKKMNARMKDALDETLILSDKIVQDLVSEILMDIGALYKASEAVALVDMLWSFAHSAISDAQLRRVFIIRPVESWLITAASSVRPEFTGTLAIKSGRHPILETLQSAGTLVPNDVYCDDSFSFQIIQGPNMSGKSTYLRQVGLLTIMAMCGSFVPAEYASFRMHDALLTRLSNDDDLERNLSTFASEMATSAMILGLATPKSLILIDELGRGTSPVEGIGISHAIAEGLIEHKCFVFFAT
ncbi:MutS protein msh4 [Stygiomarasmius scandens]|uniref:MutS protein msh4 n=1 Tax=Marasmiellus scandens TaxID=2682957 RepID=A0ABR1JYJ5_9AGAR